MVKFVYIGEYCEICIEIFHLHTEVTSFIYGISYFHRYFVKPRMESHVSLVS